MQTVNEGLRSVAGDCAIALILVVVAGGLSAHHQARITAPGFIDQVQYLSLESQFQRGMPLRGEKPFAYRIGAPWVVSAIAEDRPDDGFLWLNIASGAVCAIFLALILRPFVGSRSLRMLAVGLFVATWIGPVRFVYFNPVYVDPPFMALACAGLHLIQLQHTRFSRARLAGLCTVCVIGSLVRETMLLVALASVFAGNPIRQVIQSQRPPWELFRLRTLAPVLAAIATIALTHSLVQAEGSRTFSGAALQWIRKPPTSYALSWLMCFGPVLAVPIYAWRPTLRFLADNEYLTAFMLSTAALAYFGGADTERFVLWSFPATYLIIAMAFERNLDAVRSPWFAVAMAACQGISSRVFWSMPDPRVGALELGSEPTISGWLLRRGRSRSSSSITIIGISMPRLEVRHFVWRAWEST